MRSITQVFCASVAIALAGISQQAIAQQFFATGVGDIPDPKGSPICNNLSAPPLDAPIVVSGVNGVITGIRVSLRFEPAHTWGGDLIVTLIAPGGSPSFALFGRRGSTELSDCGSPAQLAGTYEFVDPTVSSSNFFTAIGNPVPAGTYRTSQVGGAPSGGTPTNFIAAFAGLTPAQINGTWTLRFRDVGAGYAGGISSASLTLQTFDPVVRNLNDDGPGSLRSVLGGVPSQVAVSFAPGLQGIISLQSTLDLTNAVVIGPGADRLELRRVGGGSVPVLRVPAGVTAAISDIAISNGQAGGLVIAGTLLGTGLHIRNNAGRGVRNDVGANLTLRASTISGNGDGSGAGLLNNGTARVVNSTFTGNAVTIGIGATVVNSTGATLDLYNITIAENTTVGAPNAAIVNAGTLNLYNSVLANAANVALLSNSGTLTAFNNLSIDASLPIGNGNLNNTATGLLPLDLDGGRTPSYLPGPGSTLINAGRTDALGPLYGNEPYLDQRGRPRVVGAAIDIGAVEAGDLVFGNGFEG